MILREPLLHFLLAGVVLFVAFEFWGDDTTTEPRDIRVDRTELVAFVTHGNPRLGPKGASEYLDSLDEDRLDTLIDRYVREEVLYREARALGLGQNDYSTRRRLITQLEYVNRGFITDRLELSEAALEGWYKDHKDKYYEPARVTFTHVFFNADNRNTEAVRENASAKLVSLNADDVAFHQSGRHGERFLYHRNYVNKTRDEIASHFGDAFADRLFALGPNTRDWSGPFESSYGYHLVLPGGWKEGYYPPLDEVRDRVIQDATRQRIETEMDRFYRGARARYQVEVTLHEGT